MANPYHRAASASARYHEGILEGERSPFPSDTTTGVLRFRRVTLGAAEAVTTIPLPDDVHGFRIFPTGNPCRFAVGEDPATPIPTADFGAGGYASADEWSVRLLEPGEGRDLRLRSATADLVVDVEVF